MENIVLDPKWLAGFMCGEGYFTVQQIKKYKGFNIGLCMHVRDKSILDIISKKYGGSVKLKTQGRHCQWRISKTDDLLKFCNDVAPYLVSYKLSQYIEWRKQLDEYKNTLGTWEYTNCRK